MLSTTGKSNAGPARKLVDSVVTAESANARFGAMASPVTRALNPTAKRFMTCSICAAQSVRVVLGLSWKRKTHCRLGSFRNDQHAGLWVGGAKLACANIERIATWGGELGIFASASGAMLI
jgi:hypothetical protein